MRYFILKKNDRKMPYNEFDISYSESFVNHDVCYNIEKESIKIEPCKQTTSQNNKSAIIIIIIK